MVELIEILKLSVSSLADVFVEPIFLMVVFVVYFQYRKLERMEISLFGKPVTSIKKKTAYSVVFGILGGYAGSAVMSLLGITVSLGDFTLILPLAVFLMMVRSRYICFSYAGGIISLASLVIGWPKINVPGIMAVIAVLHMIESILIFVDGRNQSTPILTRTADGMVAGGFYLQKFWPIPMIVIVAMIGRTVPLDTGALPSWWPAFMPEGQSLQSVTLQLTGLVAVLGYGDMTLSRMPAEKTAISSLRLAVYSFGLLALALLSARYHAFKFVAALFAPLAHEGLIMYSRREEKERKRLFEAGETGMMVLHVEKNGPGHEMGLQTGDRILKINNRPILDKSDLDGILQERLSFIWVEAVDGQGRIKTGECSGFGSGISDLGCLYVVRRPRALYRFDGKESSGFERVLKRLKKHLR